MLQIKKTSLIITAMCVSSSAFAGGYRVALQGQQALGMGHAGVAMTDSAEVVFFNPAGMAFLEGDSNIVAGITLIDGNTKYQNAETNTMAETDNPIGTPVGLYYTTKIDEQFSFGLGLYTPYGNTVEWEKNWAGSHLVNKIEFKAIYIQPTMSYKINDQYSVGLGLSFINGGVEFNRNLSTSLVDEESNRSNLTVKADSVTSFGYNIGFLAKPNDAISIGVSYRSESTMEARGDSANFQNIPASLNPPFTDTTFNADLVLPAEFTVGFAYNFSPGTVFAFDINRTFWGAYESLDIEFANSVPTSINPRNYQDANIYRFGVQHALNETSKIRGGIYFDKTPVQQGYFAPETPRNDAIGITAGASFAVTPQMDLDLSLLILMFDEFSGSYDYINNSDGSTSSFGGEYKSAVTTLGFGLNYKF